MVSFEVQTLRAVLNALALAAAGVPYAALSDPAEEQRDLIETIQTEQSENGPYSAELLDSLTELGLLYQEDGDHALASATIERALQVVRANYGLRSLDQAPLIRQLLLNQEAVGNSSATWDLERRLLVLAREHPSDIRAASIYRELGDRRMDVLRQYLGGQFPPEIVLGCYYKPPAEFRDERFSSRPLGDCDSGQRDDVVDAIVSEAQRNYLGAIRVLLRNRLYSSDELDELEAELVTSSYQHGRYDTGRQSLRRQVAYATATSEPWLTRVEGLVQIADWDLMFPFAHGAALEEYQRMYDLLVQAEAPQEAIDGIFSPAVPVVVPAFLPNPLATEQTSATRGYIDVAFEVTKYGGSRKVEILGESNASDEDRDRLISLISRSNFRPRVTDGQFSRASPVAMRYYLNERSAR